MITRVFLQTVSVAKLYILHVELYLGLAAPVVFFELVADVEHLLAADAAVVLAQLEADGRVGVGAVGREHRELQMVAADDARGLQWIACQVVGAEHAHVVVGSERRELLENAQELGRDVREAHNGIDFYFGGCGLGRYGVAYDLFETFNEPLEVLGTDRHAGGALVATEMLEQVAALFEGGVDVELLDAARRADIEVVGRAGQHDGGPLVGLDQA